MKFYSEKEALYLETLDLGLGLGAGLFQAMDSLQFSQDELCDKIALQLIALISNSLTNTHKIQQHRKRSIGHTSEPGEISTLLLCP